MVVITFWVNCASWWNTERKSSQPNTHISDRTPKKKPQETLWKCNHPSGSFATAYFLFQQTRLSSVKVTWFQGKEVWGRGDRKGTSPVSPLPKEKRLEKRRHGWNLSDKLAQSEIPYKLTASSLEILYERKKRFPKFKKQKQRKNNTTCYLWRLCNY